MVENGFNAATSPTDSDQGFGPKCVVIKSHNHNITRESAIHRWWRKRSGLEKTCLVFLCLTTITAFCLLTRLLIEIITAEPARCTTRTCVQAAGAMLDMMDPKEEPCDNFYRYACGGFLKHHEVPDDFIKASTMRSMQEGIYIRLKKLLEGPVHKEFRDSTAFAKMQNMYKSCINTSSVEDNTVEIVKKILDDYQSGIGTWPSLDEERWLGILDLERRLVVLQIYSVEMNLLKFHVQPDTSHINTVKIYEGSPAMLAEYYLNTTDDRSRKNLEAYRYLIKETMTYFGVTKTNVEIDTEDIIRFETEFVNISRRSLENNYNDNETRFSVDDLQIAFPELHWQNLFFHLFSFGQIEPNMNTFTAIINNEFRLKRLLVFIRNTPQRIVANYLAWSFIYTHMRFMDTHARRLFYDFRREVPNTNFEDRMYFARWKECVQVVVTGFRWASTALFIIGDNELKNETETYVRQMLDTMKQAYIDTCDRQEFLDDTAKILCKEKLSSMENLVGFPKHVLDIDQLDYTYNVLDISNDHHFFINILKLKRHQRGFEISRIGKVVDNEKDWRDDPLEVNAGYDITINSAIIPVGILRPPILSLERPEYLNYGALGIVILHEYTHAFDAFGGLTFKIENETRTFSDEFIHRLHQRFSCFAEQYSKFPMGPLRGHVNGNHTLEENICDNAALQLSYEVYKQWQSKHGEEPYLPGLKLNNDQMFFLQFAQVYCEVVSEEGYREYILDEHSPGEHRANAALQNSPAFSRAYDCPEGTAMNPTKKCYLWD